MNVSIFSPSFPFIDGGCELLGKSLEKKLNQKGFRSRLLYSPQHRFDRQWSSYLCHWLWRAEESENGESSDAVISLKYPAFLVRHPNHILWLTHRMRVYYDLWPQFYSSLASLPARVSALARKRIIHRIDYRAITRVKKVFAISACVADRLKKWGGIRAEVLNPPPPERDYASRDYGNYFLAVSRLEKLKRLQLFIEAVGLMKNKDFKAHIIGDGPYKKKLIDLINERRLNHRVILMGNLSDESLVDGYGRARAVFFGPFQEDYGFVSLEAFRSEKPVITCSDSGGTLQWVKNEKTGFVTEPQAGSIAAVLDLLAENPDVAKELGKAAAKSIKNLNWDSTVETLIRSMQ